MTNMRFLILCVAMNWLIKIPPGKTFVFIYYTLVILIFQGFNRYNQQISATKISLYCVIVIKAHLVLIPYR